MLLRKRKKEHALSEFNQFLVDYRDDLDPKTTIELLKSHGQLEPLLHYAKLSGEHDLLVQQLIELQSRRRPSRNPNPYRRYEENTYFYRHAVDTMLDVYKTLDINSEASRLRYQNLVYKFSSILIEKVPCELVTVWTKSSILQPRKLLPALANYDPSANAPDNNSHQGIRYLEHCVYHLEYHDQTLHNALLSLYAKQPEEDMLISFINRENRCFDLQYGLRQCMLEKKRRSSVLIYRHLGLLEEAVELALGIDEKLARDTAKMADDDDALSKRLWLRVARHVVEEKGQMEKAMDFLKECPLLKIEDILPFFKDFVVIDEFQEEICSALKGYNKHIEELKHEMILSESSSDLIRKDIRKLRQKCGFVTETHECDFCSQQLLGQGFYLFPCEHAFHTDCFSRAVKPHMDPVTLKRLEGLEKQLLAELRKRSAAGKRRQQKSVEKEEESTFNFLSKVLDTIESTTEIGEKKKEGEKIDVSGIPVSDLIQEEIDRIVASECLFCGDIMINSVTHSFIDHKTEEDEVLAWAVF
uniref:Pep3/Vps18 RING C-terminal domain-containing protein n=1 Tax=Paramoeba aestuarina TaxID=180227 RepID=A0A7S4L7C0_9EUKA|mmetsp:Transcript_32642/g.51026  ORF Transcript_32642/g.51026 Transcript_32642/m.51026 type:complete len:528 (+) Transcript_32642:738-2321(+)